MVAKFTTALNPLPSAISTKCPSKAKPVTSVMAFTPFTAPISSPILFSCIICFAAMPLCSSFKIPFFSAVVKIPTPNGLVKNNTSPACARLFCLMLAIGTNPFTARPKIGSGESMLCPPASGIPASAQILRLPSITFWATSGGNILMGQPRMAMASAGLPPMA